jgi:hypothetical protein
MNLENTKRNVRYPDYYFEVLRSTGESRAGLRLKW